MVLAVVVPQGASAAMTAKGSVEQVYVTGAQPGSNAKLIRKGEKVATDEVGELGGALFREVKPGPGYFVVQGKDKVGPLRVLTDRSAPPNTKVYDQELQQGGYGYIEMRDGTKLAANVSLPLTQEPPPYPTLIEYSGYGTADPDGPESGIAIVGNALGYAVVDVNMRGTGCSGGAFDFFETLQSLDGYDIVETVARQPWVKGEPGMFGISYGGISQLFTAQTQPPSLAAITPLSVIDNTQTTLYPGGMLNTGFALEWAKDRVEDSRPAGPEEGQGQPWAYEQIQSGDEICKKNQELHTEAIDLLQKIKDNAFYKPKVADPLNPSKFVHKINVPTFMACQWQDEQTGGHCPTLASRLTGTDKKWVTFTNGVHPDSLDPDTFNKLLDFLEIYVAKRRPGLAMVTAQAAAPVIYSQALGIQGITLRPDPIQLEPTYEAAKAAFEALPPIRILFENGAGRNPGEPYPAFERYYNEFPIPRTSPRSYYFGEDGTLTQGKARKKAGAAADAFTWNADARPPTNFTGDTGGGDLWTASPSYDWSQPKPENSVSYMTEPLAEDVTVVGDGEVELWVRSEARSVDLIASVSEVRPDGKEAYVQSGYMRTSVRKVFKKQSTLGDPVPTFRKKDAAPLKKGKWTQVRVPLFYQAHPYREGSRIRVTVQAPGGDQPIWAFAKTRTFPRGTPEVAIARDSEHASRLVLPVVGGLEAPTELPPCPGLRGQPCRDFEPFENRAYKP
jgi:uncharacterized protein